MLFCVYTKHINVFKEKKIDTKLTKEELHSLLELCTKKMHFSYNGKIYKQTNGVAMGSPLGPVIANIFMVHLEETLIPRLSEKMSTWYRYVDDTFTFIKEGEIDSVQDALNSFHQDIKFTYELESENAISFLDVNVTRKTDGTFDTAVYRKKTDNSIYINWEAFATRQWKIGTLKGLFRRAFLVFSTNTALEKEIAFLKNIFIKINGYPSRIVEKTLNEIRLKCNESVQPEQPPMPVIEETTNKEAENDLSPYMCLPYKGLDGERIIRNFKKNLKDVLPKNFKPQFFYKGTKLGSFFTVKDKVNTSHQTNLVYGYIPRDGTSLRDGYVGETRVRFGRRTHEHQSTDKESSIYKNSRAKNIEVSSEDFKILEKGFPKYFDRRIAESLYIKEYNPSLNEQKDSYRLKLFN